MALAQGALGVAEEASQGRADGAVGSAPLWMDIDCCSEEPGVDPRDALTLSPGPGLKVANPESSVVWLAPTTIEVRLVIEAGKGHYECERFEGPV